MIFSKNTAIRYTEQELKTLTDALEIIRNSLDTIENTNSFCDYDFESALEVLDEIVINDGVVPCTENSD